MRQPGSALRTAATCSFSNAASASPLPFAARIFATTVSTSAMALALLVGSAWTSTLGWRRHDVFVAVALGDELRMQEDVESDVEGGARDLDVRRPAAELLVVGDGGGQHGAIDLRKERCFGLRHRLGRGADQPGPRLAIGAHEALGHVGAQPLAGGRQARERDRTDRFAHRGHHVTDPVVLELLRRRALLVDVVALALAEGAVHLSGGDVDGLDRAVVEAALVAGELEHGERLAAVI